MIKYTVQNEDQEVKFWVDSESGSLCIEWDTTVIEVPYVSGIELISLIRQKQSEFEEANRKNWIQRIWR